MPDAPMEPNLDEQWEQMRQGWEREDGAQLQSILQRAMAPTVPSEFPPAQTRHLRPELVQLLSHFGASPPWEPPAASWRRCWFRAVWTSGRLWSCSAHSFCRCHGGSSCDKQLRFEDWWGATGVTGAPGSKGAWCDSSSDSCCATTAGHQIRDQGSGDHGSAPDKKREQAMGNAMRPFGVPVPKEPPPNPSLTVPMDKDSDDELDGASPTGMPSPGLGRMG